MRSFKNITAAVLVMVAASLPLLANDDQFMLLATTRTSTMQKELDAATQNGFRLVVASGLSGQEIGLMMEKIPNESEKYGYRLLATQRTGTMQKEISAAAAEGFRVHLRGLTTKAGTSARSMLSSEPDVEIVVIMERDPNQSGKEYEYKFLATSRTGTLQKEITEAVKEGYSLRAFSSRGEHLAIMEREKK